MIKFKNINKFLKNNNYKYNENYPIKKLTTIGVGGIADYVVYPLNIQELIKLINYCNFKNIKYEILGNGSNVLYSDRRFKGIIISTVYISRIYIKNDLIFAMCGAKLPYLAYFAMQKELSNFESLALIPGTVGASVCINAGAYGKTIGDSIIEVIVLDSEGIKRLKRENLEFSYRNSNLKKEHSIVLFVILQGSKKNKNEIKSLMDLYSKERFKSQPLYEKNFGSIFKNPKNEKVYKIIKECELEEYSYHNVKLSKKHLNFLQISTNNCAKDILYFIENLREKVYNKVGILLDNEVILVNWRRKDVKRIKRTYK